MTSKQNLDENQIWTLVMITLPVVILMNLGNDFTDDGVNKVLYAGLFGWIGGLIGFATNHFTKDKGRIVKIITTALLILVCILIIFSVSSIFN